MCFLVWYVRYRLWQDSQNWVYLIKELDRITGQGQSAISVDDTLALVEIFLVEAYRS
ncbi:Hydroxyproline O-galactosyltransferase HPGT1 [Turnera subulata]|uniref:Hydroxyproline O-galactosyltransferase HPGT1 n=1 Tax=Turnera subulata TaxID=218843 RepID=A0A9Q0GDE9_9ROSI|nr:Hydroxyproline O-galactosyltransferase HPGT1 [Turnera subulata]